MQFFSFKMLNMKHDSNWYDIVWCMWKFVVLLFFGLLLLKLVSEYWKCLWEHVQIFFGRADHAFEFLFLSSWFVFSFENFCSCYVTGGGKGSFLMEQWAHWEPDCREPTCYPTDNIWCIRKEYTRSLESGNPRSELQCPKNVPGDGYWTVREVSETVWGNGSRGWSTRRASWVGMEENRRSCYSDLVIFGDLWSLVLPPSLDALSFCEDIELLSKK